MHSLSRKRNQFILTVLIVPIVLLILFVVMPALNLFGMSLTDWDGLSKNMNFIGIANYYTMIVKSPDLWLSLRNNAIYFFVHLLFIPLELGVAAMLNSKIRGAGFFKSMTFLPYIINGVAISYTFSYFFSPINGAFNEMFTLLGLEIFIQNFI